MITFQPSSNGKPPAAQDILDLHERTAALLTTAGLVSVQKSDTVYRSVHQPLLAAMVAAELDPETWLIQRFTAAGYRLERAAAAARLCLKPLTRMVVYGQMRAPMEQAPEFVNSNLTTQSWKVADVRWDQAGAGLSAPDQDPLFPEQWGLRNTGQLGGNPGLDIKIDEAWTVTLGSPDVTVAVLDSGVDYLHEDLAANIAINPAEIPDNGVDDDGNGFVDDVRGWDFISRTNGCDEQDCDSPDNDPMDHWGHGTQVAGIIAASAGNGLGIAGVAPNCKVLPVRIGYEFSSRMAVRDSDVAAGLLYAALMGVDVVNMSFGTSGSSGFLEELQVLRSLDVVLVAATGFVGGTFPAALPEVLGVSPSGPNDRLPFNIFYYDSVDLAAPGLSITTTLPGNRYGPMTGSSAASAHVAGAAALMRSRDPELPAETLGNLLKLAATDVLPTDWDQDSGNGRLNIGDLMAVPWDVRLSAAIESPNRGQTLTGMHDVIGSVPLEEGMHYTLSVSADPEHLPWRRLSQGAISVENEVLHRLDTLALSEGAQFLKLTVITPGLGQFHVIRRMIVDNIDIELPVKNDLFRAGDQIRVTGETAFDWDNIQLAWRVYGETTWQTDGTSAGDGVTALGYWDTTGLGSGEYEMELRFTLGEDRTYHHEVGRVELNEDLLQGWPLVLDRDPRDDGYEYSVGNMFPVTADLDIDGFNEVLINYGGNPDRLMVFNHKGELQWRYDLEGQTGGNRLTRPIVADLNGDGFLEVYVHQAPVYQYGTIVQDSRILGFDAAGRMLPGLPHPLDNNPFWVAMTARDLDGDCRDELLVQTYGGEERNRLLLLEDQAQVLFDLSLPIEWVSSGYSYAFPIMLNLDQDPQGEVVYSVRDPSDGLYRLYAVNSDGSPVVGWEPPIADLNWFSLTAVDVDSDGIHELLANDGDLHMFDATGTDRSGWPYANGMDVTGEPALADVDGDGVPEIAVMVRDLNTHIRIVNAFGGTVASWRDGPFSSLSRVGMRIADVTGDGRLNVINDLSHDGPVFWDLEGNRMGEIRIEGRYTRGQPELVDVDGDGDLDLVAAARGVLYAFDLGVPDLDHLKPWPIFRGDQGRSGVFGERAFEFGSVIADWPAISVQDILQAQDRCGVLEK